MNKNIAAKEKNIKPFLKWAGGKRWFVANHSNLIPKRFNRYIEPFLGSGAVYFFLSPKKALLGDRNDELITTYKALKENWKLVYRYLLGHHKKHCKDYYYEIRSNPKQSLASKAARFIYLNRTCWNGLYRVNKKGEFNVPIGSKEKVIFEDDSFESISKLLKKAELYACDFEVLIDKANKEDLLFIDPPYTVRHNNNGFVKYNEKLFSWDDQIRLSKALIRANERGVKIVATNAFHESLIELYESQFYIHEVARSSSISSNPKRRKKYKELVIVNN